MNDLRHVHVVFVWSLWENILTSIVKFTHVIMSVQQLSMQHYLNILVGDALTLIVAVDTLNWTRVKSMDQKWNQVNLTKAFCFSTFSLIYVRLYPYFMILSNRQVVYITKCRKTT